ncbi:AEC family transporter [Pseudomonas typographi]|uniref:AEC family transporter n=1 Tax=Pseudomonas typographi TaxID=2715964 RepID=A0ABR7Z0E6_9PSED|nr:AEC family transporter [Pseudomonas typographi]MBD1586434.1 AEC family transporter [Pseudomonas typographi]MBD1598853.1 AEC family transporter [Pseudomonas typographi]
MAVPVAILPIFLLIILGYVLGRRQVLDPRANQALAFLAFNIFMPMVLFTGMANAPLRGGLDLKVLGAFFIPALMIFAGVNVIAHRVVGHPTPFGLTACFGNNVLIGLPLVATLFGPHGLVLLFTVLAVHSLLLFTFQSLYSTVAGSEPFRPRTLVKSLANPTIVGLLCGLLLNLAQLSLPGPLDHLAHWLAQAALPCALIVLGANLAGFALKPSRTALGITFAKLFAMPLIVLLACKWLALGPLPTNVLVLMAANPCGVNTLGFSRTLQDSQKASSAICLSTVLAALTLPLWMWLATRV